MNYTAGYIKDALGSFFFATAIIILFFIENINKLKKFIIITLIICFTVDFIFTLNKKYHHKKVGYNIPTFLILSSSIIISIFALFFRRNFIFS